MIQAKRNRAFEWMMRRVTLAQTRRQFHAVYWKGENPYPQPAIYIANHSSWWDGLLYFHLRHTVIDRSTHIMMHEKGLKKFWYFRFVGAFSINKSSTRDIVESLTYTRKLLETGTSVWIFPQGEEYSQEKRPLALESGIGHLARQLQTVPIIPITTYYWHGHHQKSEVAIRGGEPIFYSSLNGTSRKEKMHALEEQLEKQLELLKKDVVHENLTSYQVL